MNQAEQRLSLRLSLLDFVPLLEEADASEAIRQSVRLAQAAEAWGYERFWVTEHHDMPHLVSTNTEVMLAHIGAHTQRIRLGAGALLLPYYRPFKAAEAFHLLAAMYPDRVDLGIGRAPGGNAHASMALSETYLEQVRRMPALLDDLADLLANRYRIEGEPVTARPVPPVPPQLWLLGTNAKSAQYAAERGTGYVFGQFMSAEDGKAVLASYRERFRPSELQAKPRTIVAVGVVCAATREAAETAGAEGVRLAFGEQAEGARFAASGEDPAASERKFVRGTPQDVKRRLLELQAEWQADELMLVTVTGTYGQRLESFRLIAEAFAT
ncbi:luciferase [Gordoniibacillus kamchatkensis]|uniref:Luciferase n=1 Tax=Gordoniibacillus kamchatkensis TaxID=1590651 RepID=A0ABR5AB12_9BACL|nr:MsnO8 family LLM class oxidoreductase [Paenibacillus sp. VKM B-2647]KIL38249.1 luciferase [Paenibacillus sp. VKM B-2647]